MPPKSPESLGSATPSASKPPAVGLSGSGGGRTLLGKLSDSFRSLKKEALRQTTSPAEDLTPEQVKQLEAFKELKKNLEKITNSPTESLFKEPFADTKFDDDARAYMELHRTYTNGFRSSPFKVKIQEADAEFSSVINTTIERRDRLEKKRVQSKLETENKKTLGELLKELTTLLENFNPLHEPLSQSRFDTTAAEYKILYKTCFPFRFFEQDVAQSQHEDFFRRLDSSVQARATAITAFNKEQDKQAELKIKQAKQDELESKQRATQEELNKLRETLIAKQSDLLYDVLHEPFRDSDFDTMACRYSTLYRAAIPSILTALTANAFQEIIMTEHKGFQDTLTEFRGTRLSAITAYECFIRENRELTAALKAHNPDKKYDDLFRAFNGNASILEKLISESRITNATLVNFIEKVIREKKEEEVFFTKTIPSLKKLYSLCALAPNFQIDDYTQALRNYLIAYKQLVTTGRVALEQDFDNGVKTYLADRETAARQHAIFKEKQTELHNLFQTKDFKVFKDFKDFKDFNENTVAPIFTKLDSAYEALAKIKTVQQKTLTDLLTQKAAITKVHHDKKFNALEIIFSWIMSHGCLLNKSEEFEEHFKIYLGMQSPCHLILNIFNTTLREYLTNSKFALKTFEGLLSLKKRLECNQEFSQELRATYNTVLRNLTTVMATKGLSPASKTKLAELKETVTALKESSDYSQNAKRAATCLLTWGSRKTTPCLLSPDDKIPETSQILSIFAKFNSDEFVTDVNTYCQELKRTSSIEISKDAKTLHEEVKQYSDSRTSLMEKYEIFQKFHQTLRAKCDTQSSTAPESDGFTESFNAMKASYDALCNSLSCIDRSLMGEITRDFKEINSLLTNSSCQEIQVTRRPRRKKKAKPRSVLQALNETLQTSLATQQPPSITASITAISQYCIQAGLGSSHSGCNLNFTDEKKETAATFAKSSFALVIFISSKLTLLEKLKTSSNPMELFTTWLEEIQEAQRVIKEIFKDVAPEIRESEITFLTRYLKLCALFKKASTAVLNIDLSAHFVLKTFSLGRAPALSDQKQSFVTSPVSTLINAAKKLFEFNRDECKDPESLLAVTLGVLSNKFVGYIITIINNYDRETKDPQAKELLNRSALNNVALLALARELNLPENSWAREAAPDAFKTMMQYLEKAETYSGALLPKKVALPSPCQAEEEATAAREHSTENDLPPQDQPPPEAAVPAPSPLLATLSEVIANPRLALPTSDLNIMAAPGDDHAALGNPALPATATLGSANSETETDPAGNLSMSARPASDSLNPSAAAKPAPTMPAIMTLLPNDDTESINAVVGEAVTTEDALGAAAIPEKAADNVSQLENSPPFADPALQTMRLAARELPLEKAIALHDSSIMAPPISEASATPSPDDHQSSEIQNALPLNSSDIAANRTATNDESINTVVTAAAPDNSPPKEPSPVTTDAVGTAAATPEEATTAAADNLDSPTPANSPEAQRPTGGSIIMSGPVGADISTSAATADEPEISAAPGANDEIAKVPNAFPHHISTATAVTPHNIGPALTTDALGAAAAIATAGTITRTPDSTALLSLLNSDNSISVFSMPNLASTTAQAGNLNITQSAMKFAVAQGLFDTPAALVNIIKLLILSKIGPNIEQQCLSLLRKHNAPRSRSFELAAQPSILESHSQRHDDLYIGLMAKKLFDLFFNIGISHFKLSCRLQGQYFAISIVFISQASLALKSANAENASIRIRELLLEQAPPSYMKPVAALANNEATEPAPPDTSTEPAGETTTPILRTNPSVDANPSTGVSSTTEKDNPNILETTVKFFLAKPCLNDKGKLRPWGYVIPVLIVYVLTAIVVSLVVSLLYVLGSALTSPCIKKPAAPRLENQRDSSPTEDSNPPAQPLIAGPSL